MDGQDMARRTDEARGEAEATARFDTLRRMRRRRTETTAQTCVSLGQQPEKRFEPLRRDRDEPGLRMDHARLKAPLPRQS